MTARCPNCQTTFEVEASAEPIRTKCSSCGKALLIRPRGAHTTACPACGTPVGSGTVICLRCGLNVKTGTPSLTAVEGEPREEAPPSLPMRVVLFVGEWLPGVLRPMVLLAAIAASALGLGIVGFGIGLFLLGAAISAFAVCGAGLVVYAQGIALLIDGEMTLLHEALVNFDGPRWSLFLLLLVLPFVGLYFLVKALAAP